ncbi:MAG: restriction endonuclease subunit S [Acidobacteria bacterium]|nr:restriction endonuclease subunit S [Acidobacteriota bacterium]
MDSGKPKPGWTRVAFGDVAVSVNDRIDNPLNAGVERYVGLEHLDSDSLVIKRWASPATVTATKLLFRKGDIIFGRRRVYQRKLAVADFDGICSAHAMVLQAKSGIILPEFLPFFMQSDVFMERAKAISVGSLSPTINWRTLASEEFALPPLDEQRRMANLLIRIEAASHALHDTHAALKAIRKSMLMHSFGQLLADRAVRKLPAGQV